MALVPYLCLLVLAVGGVGAIPCPSRCTCRDAAVTCMHAALTQPPPELASNTHIQYHSLDLSHNLMANFTTDSVKGLRLRFLSLAWNRLEVVNFSDPLVLRELTELDLSNNRLSDLPETSLRGLVNLRELRLDRNRLNRVPNKAFRWLVKLEALSLAGNTLKTLTANSFESLTKLMVLDMRDNYIQDVEDEAFAGLSALNALEMGGNRLTDIPRAISRLTALQSMNLGTNNLTYVRDGILQRVPSIENLELRGNPIITVGREAFSNLPRLRELELSGAKELFEFPDLNGTHQLRDLRIYGSRLTAVPDDLCTIAPQMRRIYLPSNQLKRLPRLDRCTELRLLDFSYNNIGSITGQLFRSQYHLHDLLLRDNSITNIPADTFIGLSHLLILDLRHNQITNIDEDAFVPLSQVQRLSLDNNQFPRLPHRGLASVTHLHCSNMQQLSEFPPPEALPRLRSVRVSYAYHCCQFRGRTAGHNQSDTRLKETIIFPEEGELDFSMWDDNATDLWPEFQNLTNELGSLGKEILGSFDTTFSAEMPPDVEDYMESSDQLPVHYPGIQEAITCSPEPTPFMPCDDLFDWWTLRCGVWVVFLLALLGNGTVVFVLIFARSKMDVPRFLVCHLAAADFFMGIYLGFLATVDASTLGEFRKYAIAWQMSAGCQIAGFLGVLSSELSVYTLAVITLERNYAITHAMHLNKRLSIKHAGYIMACGWVFALIMATLPLVGVSDYRRFAVCLPFQTAGAGTGYVVFLMFINGVAFTILMGCYWRMYCAIRGSQAWNSNDSRIAKRMALLVFTDFLCWAPIAFFALTSAFGVHLIGLSGAKVFTVFILPFNSCCNPFLYAILTKQFKKDCVMICKTIEESRVTRGIGRGRHSSNFSNRHTPANTNSLADRTSKESKDSAQCSCNQRLLADGTKQAPRSRWEAFRALWCPSHTKEQLDNSNEYAFQIAEIQKNQEKNKRNVSLSSENFSSTRSDSLRQNHGGIRMHAMQRRRNSWTVTRKPSQDSNLSSSRNDSSATAGSNTTQSWRLSRSSVSSDVSNSTLIRAQNSLNKAGAAAAVEGGAAAAVRRPIRPTPGYPHPVLRQSSRGILKPKPKLTRQVAVWDEQQPGRQHDSGCPLHSTARPARLQVYSKLTESSQEEMSALVGAEREENVPNQTGPPAASTSGLTVAFIPRKLSTISSQSCSLQKDSYNNLGQLSPDAEGRRSASNVASASVASLNIPLSGGSAAARAHSAGDVRRPSSRPAGSASDTCLSSGAAAVRDWLAGVRPGHPPPADPAVAAPDQPDRPASPESDSGAEMAEQSTPLIQEHPPDIVLSPGCSCRPPDQP